MRRAAETLSRLARGIGLVLLLVPGGTVELLPHALGRSCTHECCRGTDACHRRSPRRDALDGPRLAARHVQGAACRDLCGLLQVSGSSSLAASAAAGESSPTPLTRALLLPPRAPRYEDQSRITTPRAPPALFS